MRKRDLLILSIAAVLAVAVTAMVFSSRTLETASWGLSFRQEGGPPRGPASREQLAQWDAAYLGDTGQKVLYLTFDAGYENGCTARILDTLKEHEVKAAFFLAGHYIGKNGDLVRRMAQEGHIVGNHTMHHPDMSAITDSEAFARELTELEALYRQTTGQEIGKFYRPPQGCYSQENLKQAQAMGYKTVFWSLAYVDWNNDAQPKPEDALNRILSRTHPGAVVLLHSTSQTNAAILGQLLTAWKEEGYRFASLEELL